MLKDPSKRLTATQLTELQREARIDQLFDELIAKLLTVMEALGLLTGGIERCDPLDATYCKESAIKRLINVFVRQLQNHLKEKI